MGPDLMRAKALASKCNSCEAADFAAAMKLLHRLQARGNKGIIFRRGGYSCARVPDNRRTKGEDDFGQKGLYRDEDAVGQKDLYRDEDAVGQRGLYRDEDAVGQKGLYRDEDAVGQKGLYLPIEMRMPKQMRRKMHQVSPSATVFF
jgi:hypothetical protein